MLLNHDKLTVLTYGPIFSSLNYLTLRNVSNYNYGKSHRSMGANNVLHILCSINVGKNWKRKIISMGLPGNGQPLPLALY